jgi:SagB-type dehydrogenase family enzyme
MFATSIEKIKLPPPSFKGELSVEEALKERRSERSFLDRPLSLSQVSQILWAAQGITEEGGLKRAAPSAGAMYPLEIYLVARSVDRLEPGVYHYRPQDHMVSFLLKGNYQDHLARACLSQSFVAASPLSIVIAAEHERTSIKYGERGIRYVLMEVGHVGGNICLQALALGLATCPVGAFVDEEVSRVLKLPRRLEPLYVLPVGYASQVTSSYKLCASG